MYCNKNHDCFLWENYILHVFFKIPQPIRLVKSLQNDYVVFLQSNLSNHGLTQTWLSLTHFLKSLYKICIIYLCSHKLSKLHYYNLYAFTFWAKELSGYSSCPRTSWNWWQTEIRAATIYLQTAVAKILYQDIKCLIERASPQCPEFWDLISGPNVGSHLCCNHWSQILLHCW